MANQHTKKAEAKAKVSTMRVGSYPEAKAKPFLHQAHDLITGDRQTDYGDKLPNFTQIGMLWQGTIAHKLAPGVAITPEDVALMMIQVKIARLAKSPDHQDSIKDVAGYAGCYDALQTERVFGAPLPGAMIDPRSQEKAE